MHDGRRRADGRLQLVQPVNGRLHRLLHGVGLLQQVSPGIGRLDPELADHPRQGEALQTQRAHDHDECEEDEQVALGQIERQRERSGQRDHAPHPRPRHRRHGAPWRLAVLVQPPRDPVPSEDPCRPHQEHEAEHDDAGADHLTRRRVERLQDVAQL